MTRVLCPEVVQILWRTIEPLLPQFDETPLGCHRQRVSDEVCCRD